MGKKCGQCSHYIGFGDWGLSCEEMYGLTYEERDAGDCEWFEQTDVCRNASRIVGGFFCSICGHTGWDLVITQDGKCPRCGNEVTGWQARMQ